jgi:methylenetetrahydrofolate dehydrogenase (NADP+)/methenyltetrahydrofolate cyclohydrolase
MQLIDGKKIARQITDEVAREVASLDFAPGLAAILVGDDPASRLYVGLKEKACRKVGIRFERVELKADAAELEVLMSVEYLNRRDDIDAFIVQLPLPPHLNADRVISQISPKKDADGFHPDNLRSLLQGRPTVPPGLAQGIIDLIKSTDINPEGLAVAVVGNSAVFYEPLAKMFKDIGALPYFVGAGDKELTAKCLQADILVVAAGRPRLVRGDMIKRGAVVIDVGTNRVGDAVVGDVDFESVSRLADFITPVPGGVGPMTVAQLLKNTVELAKRRRAG